MILGLLDGRLGREDTPYSNTCYDDTNAAKWNYDEIYLKKKKHTRFFIFLTILTYLCIHVRARVCVCVYKECKLELARDFRFELFMTGPTLFERRRVDDLKSIGSRLSRNKYDERRA